jgi:hypothetical protein
MKRCKKETWPLEPVAVPAALEREGVFLGRDEAVIVGEGRGLAGAEVGEDDSVAFLARVVRDFDLVEELAVLRLGGLVDAAAGGVVEPAVVEAAQPAVFEAAEREVDPAVGAEAADEGPAAGLLALEQHQVLAHDAHLFDGPVRGHLGDECHGLPVRAQQLTERRARPALGEFLVVFSLEHGAISSIASQIRMIGSNHLTCVVICHSLSRPATGSNLSAVNPRLGAWMARLDP